MRIVPLLLLAACGPQRLPDGPEEDTGSEPITPCAPDPASFELEAIPALDRVVVQHNLSECFRDDSAYGRLTMVFTTSDDSCTSEATFALSGGHDCGELCYGNTFVPGSVVVDVDCPAALTGDVITPTDLLTSDWIGYFAARGSLVIGDGSGSTDLVPTSFRLSVDERGSGSWVEIEGMSTR